MRKWVPAIALVMALQTAPASADNDAILNALEGMKQQMAQMQRTIDEQNRRIQQLESTRVLETAQPSMPVQASSTMSDADFQKALKDNIGEVVPFMKGAKFGGDLRLRYESFDYWDNNDAENIASDRTRNRYRIRLRWGFEKDYGDDWKAGFRLATATAGTNGLATDNTSTNVTLGNPGYFAYKNFYVDRAYATYSPNGLKDYGALKGLTIGAGKFDNPFLRYSTTIVWDADVTPEGLYEKANFQLVGTEDNKLNFQAVAGQFITHENSGVDQDSEIFGYQGALSWSTYHFDTDVPVEVAAAVSYYDYPTWSRTVEASNNLSTSFLRTNTRSADNFRVLDFYPEIVLPLRGRPLTLWANWVENIGNLGSGSANSLGNDIHDADTAWGLGLRYGKVKKKGDWEAFYGYYELGANAVVAAFNDSDFGGPGGNGFTNRQGHKFGLSFGLTDAVTVNWTGYVVTPLNPGTVVANSINETVFRSQADVVFKF